MSGNREEAHSYHLETGEAERSRAAADRARAGDQRRRAWWSRLVLDVPDVRNSDDREGNLHAREEADSERCRVADVREALANQREAAANARERHTYPHEETANPKEEAEPGPDTVPRRA